MSRNCLLAVFFSLLPFTGYVQADLNTGLVAYYPFDGDFKDKSGGNNNPSYWLATLTVDRFGKANGACFSNGRSNYIRIRNNKTLNVGRQLTLSVWVKVNGFYQGPCHGNSIIAKGDNDNMPGMYLLRFADGTYTHGRNCENEIPDVGHEDFGGIHTDTYTSSSPYIKTGTWYHVVYIFDGRNVRLYVNCKLAATGFANGFEFNNNEDLFLGRLNDEQFPYWFNGVMDEVRIYNRALSIKEVMVLCDKKPDPTPTDIPCIGDNVVSAKFGYTITDCTTASFSLEEDKENALKKISWQFGDGGRSEKHSPTHLYKKPGSYTVTTTTTSKFGCLDRSTVKVKIIQFKSDFIYNEQGSSDNIVFKAASNMGTYSWDFGDGQYLENLTMVNHVYRDPGTYNIRLFARNTSGCTDTVIKQIIIPRKDTFLTPLPVTITKLPAIDSGFRPEKRETIITRVIEAKEDSLTLLIYDNGNIDGDSITLIYNDSVILTHQALTEKPLTLVLKLDKHMSKNELLMYAENLGSIPPNTGLMIIKDGEKRYEINVSSNRTTNGGISILH